MVALPFCGQSYKDLTLPANAQQCVNLYPFRSPVEGNPNRLVLYPTPGYSLWIDMAAQGIVGAGAIRGFFELNGVLYTISGTRLVKTVFDGTNYTHTAVGTLLTSSGRCSIACNTVQLAISDGAYGYVYNIGSGAFTTISGGSWPSSGGVTNFTTQDSYTLAGVNGSRRAIQADLLNAGSYPALAYVDETSFPDNLVGVVSDQLQVYIFGPYQTEVRFNAATTPFAFAKVQGVLIQAGCASIETVKKVGSTLMWLAKDQAGNAYVAALEGYSPKVMSTPPINQAIDSYSRVSDAFAYTYREGDDQFYSITFPTPSVTWVLHVNTGFWHERSVNGGRDLPEHYVTFQGRHVVGDSTGKLYYMSHDYSTDQSGNGLTRIRTCQHIDADGRTMFIREVEIDIETGVGLLSGQGSAPLATLEISKDGGRTWINLGTQSMGAMGQYQTRLIWRRLGRARKQAAFRLTITDPVRTYIRGARAQIDAGDK